MNDLEKVLKESSALSREINNLIKLASYNQYDDLSGLNICYQDAEQLLLLDELRMILEKLCEAKTHIDYLNKPIKYKGKLSKNSSGRYELGNGHYYSCGSGIEVLISNDWHEAPCWTRSRIEHAGEDYYLIGHKNLSLEGLKARIRGKFY